MKTFLFLAFWDTLAVIGSIAVFYGLCLLLG